jgi:hypothetical protein
MPVDQRVQRWRTWIHEDIRHDVVGMYFRRQMWLEINEILIANPTVGGRQSSFWAFHHENYAAAQAFAIRRQTDTRRDVCSLRRLLSEIAQSPDVLTREVYVDLLDEHQRQDELMVLRANQDWDRSADQQGRRFDGAIAGADATELDLAADRVSTYVNEHVAHDAAAPIDAQAPTFEDLHQAVQDIGGVFQKYASVLTGAYWALDQMITDNWRAVFREPWIAS